MPFDIGATALALAVSLAAVIWVGIALHALTRRGRRRSTIKEIS